MVVYVIYACALLSLIAAFVFSTKVRSIAIEGAGDAKQIARLKEISEAIAEGAMAFLYREYKYVTYFALAFSVLIFYTNYFT